MSDSLLYAHAGGWKPLSLRQGSEKFRIIAKNRKALTALISLDELHIGEAYMNGLIDLDRNTANLFLLRNMLTDVHPLW